MAYETLKSYVLKGDICYSKSPTELCSIKNGYVVCVDGKSKGVFAELPDEYTLYPIFDYTDKLIIPGMVDIHIHAPQFSFRGTGMDLELMDWLASKTFPEEAKYYDLEYAEKAYRIFVDSLVKSATTHACIFATKHREATEKLMELMEESGLISYVGKVNMDREAPEVLCEENPTIASRDTALWIENTLNKYERTKPILTPRFIPCCSVELLTKLSELQEKYDLPVQSHLSENHKEIAFVKEVMPKAKFYGDAYDLYGLFGEQLKSNKKVKTIMAHSVYSIDEEVEKMKENCVFVAHCPTSNTNLSSGIAPIRKYLSIGLKVGLGSDVAGGHTESMFQTLCSAVQVSKLYWCLKDNSKPNLSFKEAFYLATIGGGEFFGKVGSFDLGYDFTAVILDDSLVRRPFELAIEGRLEGAVYSSLDLFGIKGKFVLDKKII